MGKDRAPSSQFYWRDWIVDTRGMTRDQRGGYIDVLAFSIIESSTPGIMTEEQVRTWAGYSETEWPANRDAFAARFRIRRDGMWIQKRTVQERSAQKKRYKRAKKGASVTNEGRWGSVAQRPPSDELATGKRHRSDRPTRGAVAPASASAPASAREEPSHAKTELSAGRPTDVPAGTTGSRTAGNTKPPGPATVTGMSSVGEVLQRVMPQGMPRNLGSVTGADLDTPEGREQERQAQLDRIRSAEGA